jgi:dihydrofolate reductase
VELTDANPRRTAMGKIIVSQNMTLDGVVQDPTGDEGLKQGGWFAQIGDKDREQWARVGTAEAFEAAAMLMGRRSDEWFATRWLSRTGEWAERLNSMPKYVVSATLDKPKWSNSTILRGDLVDEVSKLKRQLDGEIIAIGSTQLTHGLLEHDLADELRLIVFPIVLGAGERLFAEAPDTKRLRLISAGTVGDNLASLTYERVRDA